MTPLLRHFLNWSALLCALYLSFVIAFVFNDQELNAKECVDEIHARSAQFWSDMLFLWLFGPLGILFYLAAANTNFDTSHCYKESFMEVLVKYQWDNYIISFFTFEFILLLSIHHFSPSTSLVSPNIKVIILFYCLFYIFFYYIL